MGNNTNLEILVGAPQKLIGFAQDYFNTRDDIIPHYVTSEVSAQMLLMREKEQIHLAVCADRPEADDKSYWKLPYELDRYGIPHVTIRRPALETRAHFSKDFRREALPLKHTILSGECWREAYEAVMSCTSPEALVAYKQASMNFTDGHERGIRIYGSAASAALNLEYKGRRDEMELLRQQIEAIENDLSRPEWRSRHEAHQRFLEAQNALVRKTEKVELQ